MQMLHPYTNKVKRRICPFCGKSRPLDWYTPEQEEACWKCKALKSDEKERSKWKK